MSTAITHQPAGRIRDMLILTRMRAEWLLWLGLTTSLNPYEGARTPPAKRADAAMCNVVNGEGELQDSTPCPKADLS